MLLCIGLLHEEFLVLFFFFEKKTPFLKIDKRKKGGQNDGRKL